MRFSSAFLVVLLLHVTAFGGIWAFDKIKAHRVAPAGSAPSALEAKALSSRNAATEPSAATQGPSPRGETAAARTRVASAERASQPADRAELSAKPSFLYTVAKGDNPVTIAHHFGVSYDDLLKLNNIEDPKKLQIGQKLRIPGKRAGEQATKPSSQARSAD